MEKVTCRVGVHDGGAAASITPRPPQGQPIVTALAHDSAPYAFAGAHADVGFVTTGSPDRARSAVVQIRAAERRSHRDERIHVFGDLVVFLDDTTEAAVRRKARLDTAAGSEFSSDAPFFAGTPDELAQRLEALSAAGLTGFRLRPAALPHDLLGITRGLVPALQRRGRFRERYETESLRGSLGFRRPPNRYARAAPLGDVG